jgi:PAS domain S-box-containing protein
MDAVIIISPEGKTTYVSGSIKNILGYTPAEVMGMNFKEFIHPEDLAASENAVILSLHHPGVPMRGHTGRVKHKNGTWRWIEPVVTNLLEDPSVRGIVDNFKDVTNEIEEKHKLKLFESVITHTKDAVLITEAEPFDEPGPKIVYVNEAFTKMTGYTAAEVIGKTPRILQGPNSDKTEIAKLSKAIKKWEACEITTINYKKNGEEFWINFTTTPVANEKGWFTHWIAIERDVTEQKNKELENELLAKISANFNAENDLQNAIIELCKTISEFGKFDWVEFYSLNLEKNQMRLLSHYLADSNDEKLFSYFPGIDTFSKSEGMAGKVWVTEKPQLWNVNDAANDFIRRESAIQIGLKTVLGIPLIFNNEIIGVLQVGTKSDINYFNKFLPTFKKLENHIGSELNRKILENDLSHLFDTIPDILSLGDFQGKFLRINKAACILLGYSEEEILYHNFNEFIHPDDADVAKKELEKLKTGETTFSFEVRFMTKSGEIIWLSWYCVSELNEGLIYSTAKNITEEKKLRELNRQVGQMVKIGSWDLDLISEKLFWSDEVHLLHETDPKIFVPNIESAVNFYREDFREMVLSYIGKSISEGKQFDFEAVIVTANKKEIWVRSMGNTESVGGKCIRVYGGIQDISIRKEAEVRLQSLTENLPGVVFQYLVYPDGTDDVKYVTKGSQEVWGYSSKEVLQNHKLVWERILAGGEIEIIRKSLALSIENKTEWNSRWKYLMPDGELKTHVGHGTPSFLTDGTVLLNAVIFDATQETKNKELLEQITKQAKIGSWVTDLVYGEHFLSDVACGILGLEPGQTIPDMESTLKYFREDFRANAQAKFMACIETGASFDFEAVIVSTDKNEKWVRTIGSAEMINNVCRKIYGSMQDISDLKEVESRLRSFSENLPGVVYLYVIHPDETASIKYVSGAVEQLFGYPAHEVMENMDLFWDQLKAAGEYEKIQTSIRESIQMKSKLTNQFRQIMPSGEQKVRIGYGGNPIFMADGNIMFNSILLDITQEAKNEQLLAQASQMARIGSWELDLINPDSNNTYWSPMVLEILEIDESYIPSYSGGLEFYVGESKDRIQKAMDLIITKGVEFDEELLVRTKKGNERWIRCIGKSETTNNIRTKIYGSYQDVNKRKKSEIQLAESENKFRTILEAEPECIKLLDASGNLLMMNPAGLAMIEADSEEQVIGTPLLGILLKEHRTAFKKLSENVFKGEVGILKFEIKGLKGTHRWLETHAVPMKNENGDVVSLLGVTRDITERKKAEESLFNSEQKNTLIMNSAMDAIICIDTKGDVIFWNPESENIFGWKENEIMGQKLSNYIIPENFRSKHDNGMEHYMKSGEAKMFNNMVELSAVNKNGETFPIELTVIPIKQGNEEFFCAFIRDITQRKISEERILNANERFEKVTEATNDVIWDWDIINETFYRSKAIEKFFGIGTSQFLVKKEFWGDKFHPEDLPKIKESINESLNNPLSKRWDAEYRIFNDKDEIIYVKEKGMIIRDIN